MNKAEIVNTLIDRSICSVDMEYLTKYIDICFDNRVLAGSEVLCEMHHILPKSLWPEYSSFKECPWNLARLTISDHCKAHYYLWRATRLCFKGIRLVRLDDNMSLWNLTEYQLDILSRMSASYAESRRNDNILYRTLNGCSIYMKLSDKQIDELTDHINDITDYTLPELAYLTGQTTLEDISDLFL